MPGRKAKPPRLYLRTERDGARSWIILDRGRQIRTGCDAESTARAADALKEYIASRHKPTLGARDPAAVAIGDVLTAYAEAKEPKSNDRDLKLRYADLCDRLDRLAEWWGDKTLSEVKRQACLDYVTWRVAQPRRRAKKQKARAKPISSETARRELEDLRSAINAYHAEHVLFAVPVVTMPQKSPGREEWLSRSQAARLLGASLGFVWDAGQGTWKRKDGRLVRRDRVTRTRRRHAARFILMGLYSARREATIRRTQWLANTTAPWLDLDRMIYHGRGRDERATKKRRPPAKIAYRLRPHLLRWYRLDQQLAAKHREKGNAGDVRHVIHRPDGRPLSGKIKTAWSGMLADAGLGPEVVRHVLRHTAATWTMQNSQTYGKRQAGSA
jgi:hypothetical protein